MWADRMFEGYSQLRDYDRFPLLPGRTDTEESSNQQVVGDGLDDDVLSSTLYTHDAQWVCQLRNQLQWKVPFSSLSCDVGNHSQQLLCSKRPQR
jgi:hypothetical protein